MCHSLKTTMFQSSTLKFALKGTAGMIRVDQTVNMTANTTKVLCFPIYSVLVALGVKTVHYFSLDVESSEMDVLRSIPFDKVDIKVRKKTTINALVSFLVDSADW